MQRFTGVKDVDYLIMEKLDDRDLLNFCLTDKYISELCNNDLFWKKRFSSRIGYGKLKPSDMSWKQYYLSLLSAAKPEPEGEGGFNKHSLIRRPLIDFLKNVDLGPYTEDIKKTLELPLSMNMKKYLGDVLSDLGKRISRPFNLNKIKYNQLQSIISPYVVKQSELTEEQKIFLKTIGVGVILDNVLQIVRDLNNRVK